MDTKKQILTLQKQIDSIVKRNTFVEGEKAWETSKFRTFLVCCITYIIAAAFMYTIDVQDFYLGALVPTIGYFLSTLSIPIIKKWWIKRYTPHVDK